LDSNQTDSRIVADLAVKAAMVEAAGADFPPMVDLVGSE